MHIQSLGERLACCHTLLCCSPSTQRSIFNTLFQVLCQPQLSHRKFNRDLNHSASGPARCFLPPCSSVIPRERRNYVILAWSRIIHKNFELHFLMLVLMKQSPPPTQNWGCSLMKVISCSWHTLVFSLLSLIWDSAALRGFCVLWLETLKSLWPACCLSLQTIMESTAAAAPTPHCDTHAHTHTHTHTHDCDFLPFYWCAHYSLK